MVIKLNVTVVTTLNDTFGSDSDGNGYMTMATLIVMGLILRVTAATKTGNKY